MLDLRELSGCMDRRFQIWAIWIVTLGIFFLLVAAYLR
jgi:hypothetical protein